MIMVRKHYAEDSLKSELIKAFDELFSNAEKEPVIICIGSILIFWIVMALVGTMLTEFNCTSR